MWTLKQFKNGFAAIHSTDDSRTALAPQIARIAFSLAVSCCLVLFLTQDALSQRSDILEVKALKSEIRSLFSLSDNDLVRIEPLIDQEGRKLVKMYVRFSGEKAEYSSRVWDQVIEDRSTFDLSLANSLSRRQKVAVKSARARMEKKVLGYLVDDYLNLLAQLLELSEFQSNEIANLYESDTTKKSQLIALRIGDVPRLQKELEYVSETTELSLKRILTADQWRMFSQLKENSTPVA
jgi:hypothetical protein